MDFTNDGNEILSQVPLSIPYDKTRPETLQEQIARMVQLNFSSMANDNGAETFEEANDFGPDDDDFSDAPLTQFQEEYLSKDSTADKPLSKVSSSSQSVDDETSVADVKNQSTTDTPSAEDTFEKDA
mgnify:CR=1 FL=1